jgi:hypothetical protein
MDPGLIFLMYRSNRARPRCGYHTSIAVSLYAQYYLRCHSCRCQLLSLFEALSVRTELDPQKRHTLQPVPYIKIGLIEYAT